MGGSSEANVESADDQFFTATAFDVGASAEQGADAAPKIADFEQTELGLKYEGLGLAPTVARELARLVEESKLND